MVTALSFFTGAMEYQPVSPGRLFPWITASSFTPLAGTGPHEAAAADCNAAFLQATYARPYSLKGLSATALKGACPAGPGAFHLNWTSFGIKGYRENALHLGAGFRQGKFFRAGGRGSMYVVDAGPEGDRDRQVAWDGSVSCQVQPISWFEAAAVVENIYSLACGKNEGGYIPGVWSCGIALRPRRGLHFAVNLGRLPSGYVTSFTAGVTLLPFLALEGGYSRETSSGSFALLLLCKNIAVSYNLRYHPHLGYSHAVTLQVRQKAARLRPLTYGRDPVREEFSRRRIDIQTCTLAELQKVPVLKSPYPERIIRYREMFGPVTEKALKQLGMRGAEITRLYRYAGGVQRDRSYRRGGRKKQRKKTQKKWIPRHILQKRRRACFAALIAAGVPASEAMLAARSLPRKTPVLRSLRSLLPGEKEGVKKKCGVY